jgi:DNA-binding protein H-NS
VEAVRVLAECGANIGARTNDGITPLQFSVQRGHHQVAELLRELERIARTQQQAAKERAQQAAKQDTAEASELADRMAAALIEEEEREEEAKTKVRLAPPSRTHRAP